MSLHHGYCHAQAYTVLDHQHEFERLFNSIFDNARECMDIIKALNQRRYGYTRNEIAEITGINPNGDFTRILSALCRSDFIIKYIPFGHNKREEHYKLTDSFCRFWLHFKDKRNVKETDYWQHHLAESEIASWRGIAFEEVCILHIEQIKRALSISGVSSRESAMIINGTEDNPGMQIDLVIDRKDDVMNICEMKYIRDTEHMPADYEKTINRRRVTLEDKYPNKTIHMTLVSTYPYDNANQVFESVVTTDDLFLF